MLVCQKTEEAADLLAASEPSQMVTKFEENKDRPVIFMFPGQGSQYVNMTRDLYETEPIFQEQIDLCMLQLRSLLGIDLYQVLFPPEGQEVTATEQLKQTRLAQPVLFTVEYALAQLLLAWGIKPQAMIGHSIGEYVAACLAGVFTLETALALVSQRAKLMQAQPSGEMLSVSLPKSQIKELLKSSLSLAAVNSPNLCVVSGSSSDIEALSQYLTQEGKENRKLHTSHAFHSQMMTALLEPFTAYVDSLPLQAPQIPYISNLTGTWMTAKQAKDPNYWGQQLHQTVRFSDGVNTLQQISNAVFLEVGPGCTLNTFIRQHGLKESTSDVIQSVRHPKQFDNDNAFLLNAFGRLWLAGVSLDWKAFYGQESRLRLPLPTYPFERQRYWIDRPQSDTNSTAMVQPSSDMSSTSITAHPRPAIEQTYIEPRNDIEQILVEQWQILLGIEKVGIHDNFFELGGHSLLATQLVSLLGEEFDIELPLSKIFEASTVAQLALIIENTLVEELEDLSEDEAQQLLAEQY